MLSDRLGHDVSKYDLDGPLPELPASDQLQSRAKLLTDAARRDNLTLRQLAQMVATGRGHYVMCGTPEQIADRMTEWFREGGADGFNVMPPYFPAVSMIFAPGSSDPAKARPVPHRVPGLDPARPLRLSACPEPLPPRPARQRGPENRYRQPPTAGPIMAPRIVVVPPSHAETAEIANKMAPAGFEIVMSSASPAELMPAMASAEYIVCYPNVASNDALFKAAPKLKLYQLLSAAMTTSTSKRPAAPRSRSATTAAPTRSRSPSMPSC